ncbi:MAG: bis(5'-nucleosyl)-tetraphosphatase (symmetrical) YqeK [Eubacteriales bacterium]|nr:bis(5'-nucleosyl)-tetraphosphatase (symmetrical) YqeK [Eubacteriales bacterium]
MLYDDETRRDILSRLSGYRLKHTLGCEKAARELAQKYGADVEKCTFAMLLHDITKNFSEEEQLNLCEKYGIIPNDVEKIDWKMLHGKTAAAIAADVYGAPPDVVHAIAYHTTGCANMTLLDKIVYMADYIEENRSFDGVKTARKLAAHNLNKAMLYGLNASLRDLVRRGKRIHMDTVLARNWMIDNM